MTPREWLLVQAGQSQRRREEWQQALAGLPATADDVLGHAPAGAPGGAPTMNESIWEAIKARRGISAPPAEA